MDIYDLKYNISTSSFFIGKEELKIYAHKDELLNEHADKTKLVFNQLVDCNLIFKYYEYFFKEKLIDLSYNNFLDIIYKFIEFHDMGKISFNFQIERLNKKNDKIKREQCRILENNDLDKYLYYIEPYHSLTSSLLFIVYYFENIEKSFKNNLLILLFAYAIYSHHSSIKDIKPQDGFIWNIEFGSKTFESFCLFSKNIFNKIYEYDDFKIQDQLVNQLKRLNNSKFSFFYSYIYSLLISADKISSQYYNKKITGKILNKWNNRINQKIENKMFESWHNVSFNQTIIKDEKKFIFNSNFKDINDLRKSMLLEASINLNKSLKNNPSKKVFYLQMPTGAGKTNTSMKLALDIIKNTNVNRLIYSMPFINIMEQNYDKICESYGLNEDSGEIRKIYSGSETIFENKSDEFKSEVIVKDDFFDYPVICTTFVSLFNSIIKNKKKYKYKLQSLSNSVIILDEIQSLPLKNWNSLYYFINEVSSNYNIYFIIMSATLPKFDKLKHNSNEKFNYEEYYLLNNSEIYFNHPLFKRTNIKSLTYLNTENEKFKEYFKNILINNFKIEYNKGLIVLNTIKNSRLVYEVLSEFKKELNFDIDLLNSSLLSSKIKKIIYKVENIDKDKRYILVSTQSIEAGVDVSFDFVIRDFSILDSIEQVRGRCNRSNEINKRFKNNKLKGNVYLTEISSSNTKIYEFIYDDLEIKARINKTKDILLNNLNYDYEDLLNYYNSVSSTINQIYDNNEDNFIISDRKNMQNWNYAKFSEITKKDIGVHIIQNKLNQYSIFVEAKIKVFVNDLNVNLEKIDLNNLKILYNDNKNNFIFSLNELIFIRKINKKWNIIEENYINGHNLLNYYEKEIRSNEFNQMKILNKEFSSILNKFIFNISMNDEEIESKIKKSKKSYFYVIKENEVGNHNHCLYSLEKGLNYDYEMPKKEKNNKNTTLS